MTDHPLTNDICEKLTFWYDPYNNMRAAYDKGGEDMLERVMEWIIEHPGTFSASELYHHFKNKTNQQKNN